MHLDDIIFIDSLPSIDLHGFDSDYATLKVKDFINDNIKLKNKFIAIIHGIGSGILKNATHNFLKNSKNVIDFKTYYYNQGVTIVELRI